MSAVILSNAGIRSDVPLSPSLRRWTSLWKDGRALGAIVDAGLEFDGLLDLLPGRSNDEVAIAGTAQGRPPLRYSRLHQFLRSEFALHRFGLGPGDRCAIALPEGPELAVCILGASASCIAAPMNPWNPEGEIRADLAETGARALVVQAGAEFDPLRKAARDCGVAVIDLLPRAGETGLFDLAGEAARETAGIARSNVPEDFALTLFTSGTSGRKKIVRIRLRDLCVGASCLAAALELGPRDCGYNMMPLFHVGGIVRNLYAPLLAGSRMIYSPGFDAAMFWDELDRGAAFNWYYASPTMHDAILLEGAGRPGSQHALRFICNAAGNLLPSTAAKLRERFGQAAVLPGYGMTECMPIACPGLDYHLERRGTSGRILGPETSIRDEHGRLLATGQTGHILVRGAPVAPGVVDGIAPGALPAPDAWFDTGDLGYFDPDGFLYIVGRSKDVIKRGGETIAPAEIEEVLVGHPDVRAALAFAVPHPLLGETVGAAIVARAGRRVDLDGLGERLSKHLIPAKWPVLLVYMDDLPVNAAGKLLRIGLAARLGIDSVDEKSPMASRLLEADCPARGADRSQPIPARRVDVAPASIERQIRAACAAGADPGVVTDVFVPGDDPAGAIRVALEARGCEPRELEARLRARLHDYLVPKSVAVLESFPRLAATGDVDRLQLLSLLDRPARAQREPADAIEASILDEWRRCLGPGRRIDVDSDFFDDLAGDSLTAVRIIARVRGKYGIALPPTSIFRHRTISNLAAAVRTALEARKPGAAGGTDERESQAGRDGPPARSQTAPATLLLQLLPAGLFPPAFRLGQFAAWACALWYLRFEMGLTGAWVVFAAMAVAGAARHTLAPLAAIGLKWTLIGRYRRGDAPLWGDAYLRWWLVRQFQKAAGIGIFGASYELTAIYYRLLGARIGAGTRIAHNADLGEFDLLAIGDEVCIEESAIVRPFVLEGGSMALRPITIGAGASIGIRSTVVPGTVVPADTDVAPMASSTEARGRNLGTRALCRQLVYAPPAPLKGLGLAIKGALVLGSWSAVFLLVHHVLLRVVPPGGAPVAPLELLLRLTSADRLAAYCALLVLSALATPFLYLGGVIAVKWTVIGRFRAGTDTSKPWPMFERWLMWQLLPNGHFGEASHLLGSNFAGISVIYRLLGSKVGERIYWPGSGNVLVEYDLFSCGNDVTFGSRSTFLMTGLHGSRPIRIEDGANVADRCVLAPGVRIERNAVLGSGTFAPENFVAPAGSTWIGHAGREGPIQLEPPSPRKAQEPTLRPYGLAMYEGQATYRVWPLGAHVAFNLSWSAFAAIYRAAPMIAALYLTHAAASALPGVRSVAGMMFALSCLYVPLHLASAAGALWIRVATKWRILGQRPAGDHFWHLSPYCQRWKMHLAISSLTSKWCGGADLLNFLEGSAYLVWFFRALGARIGANVCLYPNGADPMMEEPDLVAIGDGACIDQAVLIAHLNTRGEWMMGPIELGPRSCLRTMSRVMMFGAVGERSVLLERTLVLAGDACLPASTWHGWPGEQIGADEIARLRTCAGTSLEAAGPPASYGGALVRTAP